MDKHYISVIKGHTPRPRSKRMQQQGTGNVNSTVVLNAEAGGSSPVSGDGHTHVNKEALDQITTDSNGYIWLELLKEVITEVGGQETTIYDKVREKVKAGYADVAGDLAEDSPIFTKFLSRLTDDIAQGIITFQQGLIALGLAVFRDEVHFGTFVRSLYAGTGAGIDPQGNAEFESVRVRTYFEAVELIINRLSAIEGDQLLTESDQIESVEDLGNGQYRLHLRAKWDGYFTAQKVNNVIKGIINNLGAAALGMTNPGTNAQMYTSWMRVNAVDTGNNTIDVTLYPDNQTPAGINFPPCELMNIARWGNQTDTTRQSCIYLSSTEGRIVKLTGVTKPIIDETNYGLVIGALPDFVREMTDLDGNPLPIKPGLDYVYAPGVITMDIIRVNQWTGQPIPNYVDRGEWNAEALYYCRAINPETGDYETSDVWYKGCKYRCQLTGTHTAPGINTTDWAFIEGNPNFTVEFNDTDVLFDPDTFDLTLYIIAKWHNQDITDSILASNVTWTRYSEDADGVERVQSDLAWNARRGDSGKSIHLTIEDMDFNGYVPRKVKITATVLLTDSEGHEIDADTATFEF